AVADGDEVAFIPPVSGGAHGAGVLFELTSRPLDARRMETAVAHKGAGAICTFTGVVRDSSRGRSVTHLEYEAYAEMATAQMRKIAGEIAEQWPEARVAMAHRTGRLEIGEPSVAVSVSTPHRAEAIAAQLDDAAGHVLRGERVRQVDEARVETPLQLLEPTDGVLLQDQCLLAEARLGEGGARPGGSLAVDLEGCEHPAFRAVQKPDSAVTRRGAELQNAFGAGEVDEH